MRFHSAIKLFALAFVFGFVSCVAAHAQAVTGTITGLVADPSGAYVAGAQVTATNAKTGDVRAVESGANGLYAFLELPVGTYTITVTKSGFKASNHTGIVLTIGQTYTLNVQLELGAASQTVTVEANAIQVQTKNTQLGMVVPGAQIENMPLINRNPIALMQLQPGVMASSDRFGTNSVNGSQTQQNSYEINGTDFNDLPLNTPLTGHLAPNPDAIGEFSLITNTINPEYGRNSGAIVNQVVKSGTNGFHGAASEFYRDTFLNAKDFFASSPQIFHRNIFDGVLGGPVIKNHLFFFGSYEGLRSVSAASPSVITVFTQTQLGGNFGAGFANSGNVSPIPEFGDNASTCKVSGGTMCAAGTAYSSLFSTGVIPTQDFNTTALAYVTKFNPATPNDSGVFSSQFPNPDSVNQELWRIDETVNSHDAVWGYGYIEREKSNSVLPFTGANVPGFPSTQTESISNYTVTWNHIFSGDTLNDLRGGYTRFNFITVEPLNPVLPSSLGFAITPQSGLSGAGLPFIGVSGPNINLGFSTNGPQPRIDQTYQADDNFSHIMGSHNLKFGFDMRRFHVTNPFFARNNGSYTFNGAGTFSTGTPFADILLGFPDSFNQTSGGFIDATAQEYYSYAQDSWTARPDLTINFGVGWQINTPFADHFNGNTAINCFRPGQQSFIYPTSPVGVVYPGDAGCGTAGYSTKFTNFGPRLGLAWTPDLGWLSGGAGKFSIRAGVGMYYDQSEEELTLQNLTAPPLQISTSGFTDVGGTAAFQNPFAAIQCLNQQNNPIPGCVATAPGSTTPLPVTVIANKFPFSAPPKGSRNIDFSQFGPLSLNLLDPNYAVPFAENYNLTVQRQVAAGTIVTVGYVGAVGRHTERASELNPMLNPIQCANNAICKGAALNGVNFLDTSGTAQFRYGPQVVSPFTGTIFLASLAQQQTDGNSHYNSLQASVQKSLSHGLDFLVSYTWAHSIDNSSNFEDLAFNGIGVNTFLPHLNYGDSAFDARQRLVVSYDYTIPMPESWTSSGYGSRLLKGWRISGFTTAQTGFPVGLHNFFFTSLTCNGFEFYSCPDNEDFTGTPLGISDPRSNRKHLYFNPAAFALPAVGTFGNVPRNPFHGPGIWDTDLALYKDTKITESTTVQLRLDAQNAFNHAQFDNPSGAILLGAGRVTRDSGPRIVQLGARFIF